MKIYHTETRADYYALLVELEEQGYSWMHGGKPTEWHDGFWEFYKENTCVRVSSDKQIQYCGIDYYKEEYPNMTILNFKEKQEYHTTTPYSVNGGDKQMKKEFYSGQPVIIKATGGQATFVNNDGSGVLSCSVLTKKGGQPYIEFYEHEQLEPLTEFRFSEIVAGLEQDYFDVETEFQSEYQTFVVRKTLVGLGLKEKEGDLIDVNIHAGSINSTWKLVESRKEMTLEEIEVELGYKIKLKDNGEK